MKSETTRGHGRYRTVLLQFMQTGQVSSHLTLRCQHTFRPARLIIMRRLVLIEIKYEPCSEPALELAHYPLLHFQES